jgi:hypothetical protein
VVRIVVLPDQKPPIDLYRKGDPLERAPTTIRAPQKLDYRLGG